MNLREALDTLGETYESALAVIAATGIRGKRKAEAPTRECLLGRYLRAQCGFLVSCGSGECWRTWDHKRTRELMGAHVVRVSQDFDRGKLAPEFYE